jgi:hypothetical protein
MLDSLFYFTLAIRGWLGQLGGNAKEKEKYKYKFKKKK